MKSEPADVSIDDLAKLPNQTVPWYGVRNYLARNFMREEMKLGDGVFFYHSSCPLPGIAGITKVTSAAYPDATQFLTPAIEVLRSGQSPGSAFLDLKRLPTHEQLICTSEY